MNKFLKSFLSLMIVFTILAFSVISVSAEQFFDDPYADPEFPTSEIIDNPEVVSGQLSENVFWNYEKDEKTLVVSGNGDIPAYDWENPTIFLNYNIEKIVIKKGIKKVGTAAFNSVGGSKTLKNVIIEDGLKSIGDCAFLYNTSLANVTIPDSVTVIGDSAFDDCTSLANVTIPKKLQSLGAQALRCYNKKVTLPNTITYCGEAALGEVNYANAVNISGKTLLSAVSDKNSYTVPKTVLTIADGAFKGSTTKKVIVPKSVKNIGKELCLYSSIKTLRILNPDAKIVQADGLVSLGEKIEGLTNSTATKYAKKYKYNFLAIDKPKFKTIKTKIKTGKKKLIVRWNKVSNADGYKLQYKNAKKYKTITIKKAKIITKTIKKLKKGKYYIRIRAYKKVRGKIYYSKYSKVKKTTVK